MSLIELYVICLVGVFCFARKSQDREKELKLLLDMYKGLPKDHRDKVQVSIYMASPFRISFF